MIWYVGLAGLASLYLVQTSFIHGRAGDAYRVELWGMTFETLELLKVVWLSTPAVVVVCVAVMTLRKWLRAADKGIQDWWRKRTTPPMQ